MFHQRSKVLTGENRGLGVIGEEPSSSSVFSICTDQTIFLKKKEASEQPYWERVGGYY